MPSEVRSVAVVRFPDGWRIVTSDRPWGRYRFRAEAEEAALRLAETAALGGGALEILVQDPCGELRRLPDRSHARGAFAPQEEIGRPRSRPATER